MKNGWKLSIIAGALCLAGGVVAGAQLGSIIKGGAAVVVVEKFGPDINKGINKLMGDKGIRYTATKVVPILSLGDGGYIGAVQVAGPQSLVDKVQAVAQLEGRFKVPLAGG